MGIESQFHSILRRAWHVLVGHRWADRDALTIRCACGACRTRSDWG